MKTYIEKKANFFKSAKPIWPEELMGQMNYTLEFRAVIDMQSFETCKLKIAVSTIYRVFINGQFAGYGPARAAKGYFRVDELDISEKLAKGVNIITIEVAAYNVENYYIMEQPEFIQAELLCGDVVIASTQGNGVLFEARLCNERVQKVPFNSFLRGSFVEYYKLDSRYADWRTKKDYYLKAVECQVVPEKTFLPRVVEYPEFALRMPVKEVEKGIFEEDETAETSWVALFTDMVGRVKKGYTINEFEEDPAIDLQKIRYCQKLKSDSFLNSDSTTEFHKGSYKTFDFGTNLTGFIGAKVIAEEKTKIIFIFDEKLTEGDVDFKRAGINPFIVFELEKGTYNLEAFEAYTLRYLKVMVFEGSCKISNIHLREFANPDVFKAYFSCSDTKLSPLFEAGRETLRQNSVDIFTDCPSRERGGYLCDSFFTARAAFELSGNTKVERNFFENYLLADKFDKLPENMLPMCYPADAIGIVTDLKSQYGDFIPNWSLWFVVQLEEYLNRSGDTELVEKFKLKVLRLFEYFKAFENENGLLEKLDGWVFVEWSKANDYVQDVNYPSNMLYAGALAAAGRIYNMNKLLEHSYRLKEEIRKQSYNGTFFVDNAVRENGELRVTKNKSEVCQYYAFFFEVATPETHKHLWNTLLAEFGPKRKATGAHPDVDPANAFIGNYLRLDLLSRYGLGKQLVDESSDYLIYMVNQTGTIWEHADDSASCNHGFGSHIVYWLYKNVLGIGDINVLNKFISLRFEASDLEWCEGRVPIINGYLSVKWWKEDNTFFYSVEIPGGFNLEVENMTGLSLVRK